jgi:hypothetical protein
VPTRGTTNPNRLRRVDRWLCASEAVATALESAPSPLVIDLGYGASPVTTVELRARLADRFSGVRVLGLEIDPERVAAALPVAAPPALDFGRGGFELAGRRPQLVRAMNVLRQYDEPAASEAWDVMCERLGPGGVLVEGTCDELGRVGSWVLLDASGPRTLTLACSPLHLDHPRTLAERLPKALIHRNVPGERIYDLLTDLGHAWDAAAPLVPFGPRQRWTAAVADVSRRWQVPVRRELPPGEITVPWSLVSP